MKNVSKDDFRMDNGDIDWDAYNEALSLALGNDKAALKKRLLSARSCLKKPFLDKFKKKIYDFENKRMTSDDGSMALQWLTRLSPHAPPSYDNQQTTVGKVTVVDMA